MARTYASLQQYRDYTGDTAAELTPSQLRSASLLVTWATRHAAYRVYGDGTAADEKIETALREATCEVLKARSDAGVMSDVSLADLGLQSASIGSASYSLVPGGAPGLWRRVPFDGWLILEGAGLVGGAVQIVG